MWEAIIAIIPLMLLIFNEFLSAQARARAADEQFKLDQESLKKILDGALQKWIQRNAKDSAGAGDAWDNADKALTGEGNSEKPPSPA